jgi:hypothetical protein
MQLVCHDKRNGPIEQKQNIPLRFLFFIVNLPQIYFKSEMMNVLRKSQFFRTASLRHFETVVSRCTQDLMKSLAPVDMKVTSSNDDPNGNHVNLPHPYTAV